MRKNIRYKKELLPLIVKPIDTSSVDGDTGETELDIDWNLDMPDFTAQLVQCWDAESEKRDLKDDRFTVSLQVSFCRSVVLKTFGFVWQNPQRKACAPFFKDGLDQKYALEIILGCLMCSSYLCLMSTVDRGGRERSGRTYEDVLLSSP